MVQVQTSATESLFHEFEFRIQNKEISSDALDYFVKDLKSKNKYVSTIDFLLCEFFPEEAIHCKHFYKTGNQPLREIITLEQKVMFESTLLLLLDLLEIFYIDQQKVSWSAIKYVLPRISIELHS